MPNPFPLRRFIWIVFVSVLIGALYSDLRYGLPGAGAIIGGSMGAALFSLDRFVLRRNAGGLFPRLPFLPYLALRTCLYAAVVIIIIIIIGIANSVRAVDPAQGWALLAARAGGRYAPIAASSAPMGLRRARRLRFCAVAARRNSSLAPFGPLRRRRARRRIRLR